MLSIVSKNFTLFVRTVKKELKDQKGRCNSPMPVMKLREESMKHLNLVKFHASTMRGEIIAGEFKG
jgi:hypothetical protein